MQKILLPLLIFTFLTASIGLVIFTTNLAEAQNEHGNMSEDFDLSARNLTNSPVDAYYSEGENNSTVKASVVGGDGRGVIIDNFLAFHHSPMAGLGKVFVAAADQYGIEYRLLPAIAFQESTLGKRIPRNSHNAFGWAIYTGANSGAKFKNWEQAIYTVAKGLKINYIDEGLTTPEQIMNKYSDSDDWAFGVNFAIEQMSAN